MVFFSFYTLANFKDCTAVTGTGPHALSSSTSLTPQQAGAAILDLALSVATIALAACILANHAYHLNLPGLGSMTNQVAYILLGTTGATLLISMVVFAIQMSKKSEAYADALRRARQQSGEVSALRQEIETLKKDVSDSKTRIQKERAEEVYQHSIEMGEAKQTIERLKEANLEAQTKEEKKTKDHQNEITRFKQDIKNLEDDLSNLANERDAKIKKLQMQQQQNTQMGKDAEKQQSKMQLLEKKVEDITGRLYEKEKECNNMQLAMTQLEKQLKDAQQINIQSDQQRANKLQPAQKTKIRINDEASGRCPYIEGDILYISKWDAEKMELNPYLNHLSPLSSSAFNKDTDKPQILLRTLDIYLNESIFELCQQAETLGFFELQKRVSKLVKERFRNFFDRLGLSKHQAFVIHNAQFIIENINNILDCLAYADEIDNKVLVLFWAEALREYAPLSECISQFSEIVQTPLRYAEYLHDVLFECLLTHHAHPDVIKFLGENQQSLTIKELDVCELYKSCMSAHIGAGPLVPVSEANIKMIDAFLSVLKLSEIQVLKRSKAYVDFSEEISHIFNKCQATVIAVHYTDDQFAYQKRLGGWATVENGIPVIFSPDNIWLNYVSGKYALFGQTFAPIPDVAKNYLAATLTFQEKKSIPLAYFMSIDRQKQTIKNYLEYYFGSPVRLIEGTNKDLLKEDA